MRVMHQWVADKEEPFWTCETCGGFHSGFAGLPPLHGCVEASKMGPEELAQLFHEAYERLAPEHGYRTRERSAVPWDDVPANNKALMIATAACVLGELQSGAEVER